MPGLGRDDAVPDEEAAALRKEVTSLLEQLDARNRDAAELRTALAKVQHEVRWWVVRC